MTDQCGNCRFSRAYAPPKGDRPKVPPEPKRKWWEDWLSPSFAMPSPRFYMLMIQAFWDGAKRRAEQDVCCKRFPEAEQKRKTDWCGEYKPKRKAA